MYYVLLHTDNSIIASGSFRECSDEVQALYPTPPGHGLTITSFLNTGTQQN